MDYPLVAYCKHTQKAMKYHGMLLELSSFPTASLFFADVLTTSSRVYQLDDLRTGKRF